MKKIFTSLLISLVFASALPASLAVAQTESIDPAFNPSLLITDQAFSDSGTFGSAGAIQDFLLEHGSVLANTSQDFLLKLKEPDMATKTALEDPEPNLGRLRTASELIYDSAAKTGLNIQVILVTLQKEQTLVTGTFPTDQTLQTALDRALGFGCPDNSPCGATFLGFYSQLFGAFDSSGNRYLGAAASLMKSFNTTNANGVRVGRGPEVDANGSAQSTAGPAVRTTEVGDTVALDNTTGGFVGVAPSQVVTLGNFATAALYRYTPHVFNGNYNFWKYFTLWFKYPNGTVIQKIGDTALYLIDNGSKEQFSAFVATQRKINTTQVVGVSETEFDSYTTNPQLTPLDGTLIKGDATTGVYIIENGVKQSIAAPVFAQRKFSFAKVVTLPQAEVDSYATGPFLSPVDGTLITGLTDHTVYLVTNSIKQPISAAVFAARKLSFRNLMTLPDNALAGITTGPFLTPPDSVQVQLQGDAGIYWYKDGQKRYVSAFVFKQRSVGNFPLVTVGLGEFTAIPTGTPFPPKDGTIIQGDQSSGIYEIVNGISDLLTPASYKRLGYPKPNILPEQEVDSYAQGAVIVK